MAAGGEVFLHAGFHKTGTTSFQALLALNRARLPAALVNHTDPGLRPLKALVAAYDPARDAATGPPIADLVRRIAAAHPGRLLVSSEHFCGPVPAPRRPGPVYGSAAGILRWAQEGFGRRPLTVALMVRDRDAWLTSLHRHLLAARGLRLSEAAFRALPAFAAFDWEAVLADIRARFGPVAVVRMEDDLAHTLGPGASLLARFGLTEAELASWQPAGRQNPGITAEAARALERPAALLLPALARKYLVRYLSRDTRRRPLRPRPS